MSDLDVLKNFIFEYKDKTYKGLEIASDKEVYKNFTHNIILYPMGFLEKVKKENGYIKIKIDQNGVIEKSLVDVSNELLDEFHSIFR